MFKVLFKTACETDNDTVRKNIESLHSHNGDEIIVSHVDQPADIKIEIPKLQKKSALVFDHSGTVHRLGLPCEYQFDELDRKSDGMDKQEQIRKEIECLEKAPKECPKCKFMKPAGIRMCPKCGFSPLGGEDVETDETRQIQRLKGKLEKPVTAEDKQQFWSEMMGLKREHIAKGKHYKDGYYSNQYRKKFSVWPKGLHNSPMPVSVETRNWIKSQQIRFAKGRAK